MTTTPTISTPAPPAVLPIPQTRWLAARGRTSFVLAATGVLASASLLLGLPIALQGPFVVTVEPGLPPFLTDATVLLELVFNLGILAAVFLGLPLGALLRFHEFLLAPAGLAPAAVQPASATTRLVASLARPARPLITLALVLLVPAIPVALLAGEDSPARPIAICTIFINLTLLPARLAFRRATADLALIGSGGGAKKAPPPSTLTEPEPPRFA